VEAGQNITNSIKRRKAMDYTELPKEFQEWGQEIEREFTQVLADEALNFQASEAEAGRVVSITDAVHHVKTKGFGIIASADSVQLPD
jgi:hypothetical protein